VRASFALPLLLFLPRAKEEKITHFEKEKKNADVKRFRGEKNSEKVRKREERGDISRVLMTRFLDGKVRHIKVKNY
jgi:CRISPR/Cas system-associated protein Csx1